MEIQQILSELERNTGVFPRAALEQAVHKQEEIIPELLKTLKDITELMRTSEVAEDYMAHLYAMYLLAQFREEKAYPVLVEFFSIPGNEPELATGDLITEDLGRILASVSGGDIRPLQAMVENETIDEYTRSAALDGITTLVAQGRLTREEVIDYFKELFRERLTRKPNYIWTGLLDKTLDLHPGELYDDIKLAYSEDLIDVMFCDEAYIQEVLGRSVEQCLEKLRSNKRYTFIDDTIAEIEWWAAFDPSQQDDGLDFELESKLLDNEWLDNVGDISATRQPAIKTEKIGRNQPCPCGSGKKYKRCCGAG